MRPVGAITRGTTGHNRLRRADRWLAAVHGGLLRSAADPLVVDLGYGASPVTTLELFARLRAVRRDLEVVGVEIDPERVAAAAAYTRPGLEFRRGGFEIPGRSPLVIRAFNVLRQYPEADAWQFWELMASRLQPGGVIVEGTCSEIGHRAVWVGLDRSGPRTLTFAARFGGIDRPSDLAERLPKTLIHRNVPGERVHAFLTDWDRAWAVSAPFGAYGARQRWIVSAVKLAETWPLYTSAPYGGTARWRLGELSLPWSALVS
ncbi:class I SAM-dependent methyltransferase [Herbidospora cretacea]|uniref:class I SAM-dependent methyltransferase n=1 Tax=Herbidospora cretacea TaxID=28444 RepID=UPI0007744F32|nr:class I SAM-dependent methyltransferase [Herbidospora cretacea]